MNLEKLEEEKEKNREQRREFVKYWADYIKNHDDKEWSRQQNVIIDSQFSGIGNRAEDMESWKIRQGDG